MKVSTCYVFIAGQKTVAKSEWLLPSVSVDSNYYMCRSGSVIYTNLWRNTKSCFQPDSVSGCYSGCMHTLLRDNSTPFLFSGDKNIGCNVVDLVQKVISLSSHCLLDECICLYRLSMLTETSREAAEQTMVQFPYSNAVGVHNWDRWRRHETVVRITLLGCKAERKQLIYPAVFEVKYAVPLILRVKTKFESEQWHSLLLL